MADGLPGTNDTSVFSVDPTNATSYPLPDTGGGADPYDTRGHDEVTLLVDNGADQSVDVTIETFAFNDEAASTPIGDVTDKEGVNTTTVAAGDTEPISVGVGALAFLRAVGTYATAPASGTLTVTFQSDKQG